MLEYKFLDGVLCIRLQGELDHSVAPALKQEIDVLIASDRAKHVILDLSGLSFMDSTGVGLVLGRYKKLSQKGIPLAIRSPSSVAAKVLQVSGITKLIQIIQ